MRSPTTRLILSALAVVVAGGATWYLVQLEKPLADRRAALGSFSRTARRVTASLDGARAAELAYVAEGQGAKTWAPAVAAALSAVPADIEALRASASTSEARAMLIEAAARLQTFAEVDARALDYLQRGDTLMASDLIFAEGAPSAATAIELMSSAWLQEENAFAASQDEHRANEIYIAGSVMGLVLAIGFLLALLPAAGSPQRTRPEAASQDAGGLDLRLREDAPIVEEISSSGARAESLEPGTPVAATAEPANPSNRLAAERPVQPLPLPSDSGERKLVAVMRSAADICVSLGAVREAGQLRDLVAQAAALMKAPGLIVWVGDSGGAGLRASVAHGYTAQALSRMPPISRSDDNAVATAYRTGALQVVRGASGRDPGAVIAPIVTPEGCVGALTAELEAGNESSEAVQALSLLFAAQLSALLTGESAAEGSGVRAASA